MQYSCTIRIFVLMLALSWSARAQSLVAPVSPSQATRLQQLSQSLNQKWQQRQQVSPGKRQAALAPLQRVALANNKGRDMALVGFDQRGWPLYYSTTSNVSAAASIGTNLVNTGGSYGLGLDGQNMVAYEWDGGAVLTTHVEFGGRVTQRDGASTLSDHATHVAGTIAGSGVSALAKGMATAIRLNTYDWNNDEAEMASAAAAGALVSNHSYGTVAGWSYDGTNWLWYGDPSLSSTTDYKFGLYDASAADWDLIARNAPYYTIVKAAGNNRGETGPGAGGLHQVWNGSAWVNSTVTRSANDSYDCISTNATAKNILTVAAVNDVTTPNTASSIVMSSFSSWGPTDDGRVKPDLSANGVSLFSASSTGITDYTTKSGTSMASPTVTGSLLLVQQYHQRLFGRPMLAASLKALAINTAYEAGTTTGPDYQFGWGLMSTGRMCQSLNQLGAGSLLAERTMPNMGIYDTLVQVGPGLTPKITVVWTDVPGTPNGAVLNNRTPKLVNDLDVRLTSPSGTVYFPYRLNPANPSAAATTGDNIVDNVEQILGTAEPGLWRITVTHKGTLSGGSQNFSVAMSGLSHIMTAGTYAIKVNTPVANSSYYQGQTVPITWFNNGTGTSYRLTLMQGSTLVSTLVTGHVSPIGNYTWTIPTSVPAGTYELQVIDMGGQATRGTVQPITILSNVGITPTITSFTPAQGSVAQQVTITGTNLATATQVLFNGTPSPVLSASATQVVTAVPNGATTGPLTVQTPMGDAVSSTNFVILMSTCYSNPTAGAPLNMTNTWQTVTASAGTATLYPFTVTGPTQTFSFSTCGVSFDSKLRIYDANGTVVAENDDAGPYCSSTAASLDVTGLTAGTYYALYTLFDCGPLPVASALQYRVAAPAVITCATSVTNNSPLTFSTAWQTTFLASGSTHLIPFTSVAASATYTFSTCGATIDTKLRVYDANGVIVQSADDNGPYCTGGAASADFTNLTPGQYYLLVTQFDCNLLSASVTLSYKHSGIVPITTCMAAPQVSTSITPIAIWQSMTLASGNGHLIPFNSTSSANTYSFSTCGAAVDTKMRLYDATGNPLQTADDNGPYCTTAAASADFTGLTPGQYYLLVTQFDCNILGASVSLQYKETIPGPPIATCLASPGVLGAITPTSTWQSLPLTGGQGYLIPFQASANLNYSFSTCGASFDTKIRLYSSTGVELISADDNGPYCTGNAASVDWTGFTNDLYYLLVTQYDCNPLGASITLQYRSYAPLPVTTCASSPSLLSGITPTANWQNLPLAAGSTYLVPFTVNSSAETFSFSLCGGATNTSILIYNSSSTLVSSLGSGGQFCSTGSASGIVTGLAAGQYYLLVATTSCGPLLSAESLAYRVSTRPITVCASLPYTQPELSLNTSWQAQTLFSGYAHVIPFTIQSASHIYDFSTCGTSINTVMRLYNSTGVPINNYDNNGPWCTGVAASATITGQPAGLYYLMVTNSSCLSLSAAIQFQYRETLPCVAAPTIAASATVLCSGSPVTLTAATAPGGFGYLWSTGATTASITVGTTGTYTVAYTSPTCTSAVASQTISSAVAPATPTISASGPTSFCTGQTVTLTASALGATGFIWNTGATTSSIVVSTTGAYSVRAINASCTSGVSLATTVSVTTTPPVPTITASGPTTFCDGGSVTLTSSATTGNLWSNGATTQSITVNSTGNYTVSAGNGTCRSANSATTFVTELPRPAAPTITAGSPLNFCIGGSVTLTSSSATGNVWSTGATTQSITVSASGNYTVTITGPNGCTATSAATVVSAVPRPAAPTITVLGNTNLCQGDSVVLVSSATFGNLWSNGATTSSITVKVGGTYTVGQQFLSCYSAESAPVIVTVNTRPATPTVTASGPLSFCQGDSVILTSSASTGNLWSNGATTQAITVKAGGTYSVRAINGVCSSAVSADVVVAVGPAPVTPTVTASGALTFCQGDSVVLTSSATTGNVWSTGATTQTITVKASGSYTVRVAQGVCTSAFSAPVAVTVNAVPAAPSVLASGALTFCQGDSVVLSSTVPVGNLWSTGATTQTITVKASGTYSLRLNTVPCPSVASAPVVVTALPRPDSSFTQSNDTLIATAVGATYQWFLGGQPVGGNSQRLAITQDGNYSLRVTAGSCSNTSPARFITDARALVKTGGYQVYPNPAAGTFWVRTPATASGTVRLQLTDVLGRVVLTHTSPATETIAVPADKLPAGSYQLRITNQDRAFDLRIVIK